MKQTAVEWLQELIECGADLEQIKKFLPKAKEMEKQQIEDAFMVGVKNEKYRFDTKTQYYNETFKK